MDRSGRKRVSRLADTRNLENSPQYLKIAFASYAAPRDPAQSSSHTPQIKAAEGRLILPRPEPATSKVQLDGTTANELNDRIPATQTNPGWAVSSPKNRHFSHLYRDMGTLHALLLLLSEPG